MAIETRTYSNCLIAGRARVGAQPVSVGRPITLVAYYRNIPTGQTLVIQNPFNINVTEVNTYVESVIAGVDPAEVDYVQPPTRLSDGIVLDRSSVPAYQTTEHDNARGVKAPPPWNKVANLWPWPGMNGRCDNTAVNWTYMVEGAATIVIPRFSMADPAAAVIPFTVANTTVSVAAWQVQLANPSDTTGGSMFVSVSYLTGLQVRIGQVPLLGQCNGWQFSPDEFDWTLDYTTYWSGNLSDLEAGATFGPFVQLVTVAVKDVGANQYFELPFYGGMWYIWNAFLMAFFWLVSNSLMLFIIILVWWNVRSNKGLPPIIYRYMQKYRGW
ncbi:hypothetical protein HYH03_000650 [Edaphochlamys debaryana]|uniref:Uncharacterized protein n=1 Tax=Edaphochlamys debaryana TaxID=47281 RepID=A0A835YJ44_9CHLO|nr:hypothetical protein HYH03_000650 [Edaphochlamys debaryana]|eukprot:KAG2502163.1 hypothetical protein HYH03_000650 [Edaphochlamys debaryana]